MIGVRHADRGPRHESELVADDPMLNVTVTLAVITRGHTQLHIFRITGVVFQIEVATDDGRQRAVAGASSDEAHEFSALRECHGFTCSGEMCSTSVWPIGHDLHTLPGAFLSPCILICVDAAGLRPRGIVRVPQNSVAEFL